MTRSFKTRVRLRFEETEHGTRLGFELLDPVTIPPQHTLTLLGTFGLDARDDGIELVVTAAIYKKADGPPPEILRMQEEEVADLEAQIARARAARAAGPQ